VDSAPNPPSRDVDPLLASIQAILLTADRERLQTLEALLHELRDHTSSQNTTLQQKISDLLLEINHLSATANQNDRRAQQLQAELEVVRRESQPDPQKLAAQMTPLMGDVIGRTIRDSRDEMAESLGPIMGEAIRVQIRDSRKDMVEALYPVIGETVQKAVGEFAREFQRNIDARLKRTFVPSGLARTVNAGLRGVSPSELALRDALPFTVREVFLIQQQSGLLLAHTHHSAAEVTDSDIISAMLTAIRDFVRDSFGSGASEKELDEVQYGDLRIVVQTGRAAYLAVVYNGVEPEGFRAKLHEFISELHVKYEPQFKQYNGDPATLPNLQPKMARLVADLTSNAPRPRPPLSRTARLSITLAVVIGVLLLLLACFYLIFTIRLLPIAFPAAATATLVPSATPAPTLTATPIPSATPTLAPTLTPSPIPTNTPVPSQTPAPTFTLDPSGAAGNVWVRPQPDDASPKTDVLFSDTPITIQAVYGVWVKVAWVDAQGEAKAGWVPLRWVALRHPIPPEVITPTATP